MRTIFALAIAVLGGCDTSNDDGTDASTTEDAAPLDAASPMDAAQADAGERDAEPLDASDPTDSGEPNDQLPPANGAALRPWLEAGNYTGWAAESAIHASTGPHFGRVRTYINAALDSSLAAGNAEHPAGAAAVKELYGMNGNTVRGWSVMVRTRAGDAGDGWYWYERYNQSTFGDGNGDPNCTNCHSTGADYFRSPYPLQ